MTAWSKEELRRIAEADDLHISPFREDGVTYGTPTWIWSVAVGDGLYVRAYNGQKSRWYQNVYHAHLAFSSVAGELMTGEPRSTWSSLRHPLFRALWIASAASHIGSYMTDVGQGWLMASLTPSPLIVSLLLTAESLPFFALGLPAGALADIVDRRRLLIVTQLAMAVAVGTLAVVTLAGTVTPWTLLALAFALGIATALNDPAWHSVV